MREPSTITAKVGSYTCSNHLGKLILQGMHEIMGREDTRSILDHGSIDSLIEIQDHEISDTSIPYRQISRIQPTLENVFGERGGKGLSYRTGQAAFRYGLHELGWAMKLFDPRFRLLSPFQKIRAGAHFLASAIDSISDQRIIVEERKNSIDWVVQRCPICWGRHADGSACHLTAGFLQEFVSWSTGGKFYSVVESECIAAGGVNCVFTIEKQAFD